MRRMIPTIAVPLLVLVLTVPTPVLRAQTPTLVRAVVEVAATNDEWTSTGLRVTQGDLVLVQAPGTFVAGQYAGALDAAGLNTGGGRGPAHLAYKIGTGAARPAGPFFALQVQDAGTLKFRIEDSNYADNKGSLSVDVLVIPSAAIPAPTPVPPAD